jgi:hypothetical protein
MKIIGVYAVYYEMIINFRRPLFQFEIGNIFSFNFWLKTHRELYVYRTIGSSIFYSLTLHLTEINLLLKNYRVLNKSFCWGSILVEPFSCILLCAKLRFYKTRHAPNPNFWVRLEFSFTFGFEFSLQLSYFPLIYKTEWQ